MEAFIIYILLDRLSSLPDFSLCREQRTAAILHREVGQSKLITTRAHMLQSFGHACMQFTCFALFQFSPSLQWCSCLIEYSFLLYSHTRHSNNCAPNCFMRLKKLKDLVKNSLFPNILTSPYYWPLSLIRYMYKYSEAFVDIFWEKLSSILGWLSGDRSKVSKY